MVFQALSRVILKKRQSIAILSEESQELTAGQLTDHDSIELKQRMCGLHDKWDGIYQLAKNFETAIEQSLKPWRELKDWRKEFESWLTNAESDLRVDTALFLEAETVTDELVELKVRLLAIFQGYNDQPISDLCWHYPLQTLPVRLGSLLS